MMAYGLVMLRELIIDVATLQAHAYLYQTALLGF